MSDEGFEIKGSNSLRPAAPTRVPGAVVVSFDTANGNAALIEPVNDRVAAKAAVVAKAQARIDAAARGNLHEAHQLNADGRPIEPALEQEQPVDDLEAQPDDAPEGEPELDEEPLEQEQPATTFELEQARTDLAEARRQLSDVGLATRVQQYDTYAADPVSWMRAQIAHVIGANPDDAIVREEADALFNELTWSAVGQQDLPDAQKAQLKTDRLDRRIRLDTHRRQAEQRATQTSSLEERARNQAMSVYDTVKQKFPAAPLAERRFGRPLDALIVDELRRGIGDGSIVDWQTRADTDLFTEAITRLDRSSRTWATNLGPQLATLTPATAPTVPGASDRPDASQRSASSQAAPRAPSAKPRTLTPQKAGAAPSRSRAAAPQAALPTSPEDRRREVIRRHAKP